MARKSGSSRVITKVTTRIRRSPTIIRKIQRPGGRTQSNLRRINQIRSLDDARLKLAPFLPCRPPPLFHPYRTTSQPLLRHAASFTRRSEMLFFYLDKGSSLPCYYPSASPSSPPSFRRRGLEIKRERGMVLCTARNIHALVGRVFERSLTGTLDLPGR